MEKVVEMIKKALDNTEGHAELVVGTVLYSAVMHFVLEPSNYPTLKKVEMINDYLMMYGITMLLARYIGVTTIDEFNKELKKLKEQK